MRILGLRTLAGLVVSMGLAASAQAGMVNLTGSDGQKYGAYAAGSMIADAAVLVVHDWFGLTDATKAVAERLAEKGVAALAVDLYEGAGATTHAEAQVLMEGLDQGHAQAAIRAALVALGAEGRPVAIVGYSMGGRIALQAATENPELIKAAAMIYGGSYDTLSDEAMLAAGPVLLVSGSDDAWAYASLTDLQARMQELGRPIETYVYPGVDHAYAQILFNDGNNFDAPAMAATENVLDDFLGRQVGLAD